MSDINFERVVEAGAVARVHERLLTPSFPPGELVPVESLTTQIDSGDTSMIIALEDADPVGVAVVDSYRGVLLLSYLAIGGGRRSGGIGGRLLDGALAEWIADADTKLILAEVERPDLHQASEAHGDPERRLGFYARHGGRALDLPYFQPSLAPGMPREPGLLLITLHADPSILAADGEHLDETGTGLLRDFLRAYVGEAEPTDRMARDLFAATDRAGGVALVNLPDYRTIAASVS